MNLPTGGEFRKRFRAAATSKSLALREGENLVAEIIRNGVPTKAEPKEVPTLEQFSETFLKDYALANRLKHSYVTTMKSHLKSHLLPLLGRKRLDEIGSVDVQAVRGRLAKRNPKTANNVVATLMKMLKLGAEWGVTKPVTFKVRPLKSMQPEMTYYDDSQFERLVVASKKVGATAELIVLLGGEAGLRAGEMLALEWSDLDFQRNWIHVQRAEWCGVVGTPKGGRSRRVPMTTRLAAALKNYRHLRGDRVLVLPVAEANMKSLKWMRKQAKASQRLAGLEASGAIHVLRHSFCSRLAMRGRSASEIQKLAGHASLQTTLRYMHLSPAALGNAVASLEKPLVLGDGLETGTKNEGAPLGTPVASST